jgi:hypothetical protein
LILIIIIIIIIIIIMKLFQALSNIIVIQTSLWYVPVVRCEESRMDAAAASAEDNSNNGMDRVLKSSSIDADDRYPYSRNYVVIIEPDNLVSLISDGVQGSSIVKYGNVFAPADIGLVNRVDGTQESDIGFPKGLTFEQVARLIGRKFAGNRQPKSPVPPGDKAFFFHGECVALSATPSSFSFLEAIQFQGSSEVANEIVDGFVQSSHTCNLNLCLGGGGFDCIAIYAGTAFTFNLGKQIRVGRTTDSNFIEAIPSLPPPFPATIIGGTGSFEGIEGTVDIATICGTSGVSFDETSIGPFFDTGTIAQCPDGNSGRSTLSDGICQTQAALAVNPKLPTPVQLEEKNNDDSFPCGCSISTDGSNLAFYKDLNSAICSSNQIAAVICGGKPTTKTSTVKVGYIVQSIKVKSNMPLPVAP